MVTYAEVALAARQRIDPRPAPTTLTSTAMLRPVDRLADMDADEISGAAAIQSVLRTIEASTTWHQFENAERFLWQSYARGWISDNHATALASAIEARRGPLRPPMAMQTV